MTNHLPSVRVLRSPILDAVGRHVDYGIMAAGGVAFALGTAFLFNLWGAATWYMDRQDRWRNLLRGRFDDPMRQLVSRRSRMTDLLWSPGYARARFGFVACFGLVFFIEELAKLL